MCDGGKLVAGSIPSVIVCLPFYRGVIPPPVVLGTKAQEVGFAIIGAASSVCSFVVIGAKANASQFQGHPEPFLWIAVGCLILCLVIVGVAREAAQLG